MDSLKCTICGELVDNYINELETHLTNHNVEFDENDMQDVLEYYDSVENDNCEYYSSQSGTTCPYCGKKDVDPSHMFCAGKA